MSLSRRLRYRLDSNACAAAWVLYLLLPLPEQESHFWVDARVLLGICSGLHVTTPERRVVVVGYRASNKQESSKAAWNV